jgi:hypothetical protein
MSNYLDRLVLRARGELQVPRPHLAPVFPPSMVAAETDGAFAEPPQRTAAPEYRPFRQAGSPPSFKGKTSASPRPMPVQVSMKDPARGSRELAEEQVPPLAATAPTDRNETRQGIGVDTPPEPQAEPAERQWVAREEKEEQEGPPRTRRAVTAHVVTVAQPASPTRPERRTPEKEASAQQTIHVSIGRVEVRAIMPPAPRPVAPPPGPQRLSLEEYMKARREKRKG